MQVVLSIQQVFPAFPCSVICFFEAQIHDQSLYEKIISRLNTINTASLTSQLESTRLHVNWILPGNCSQEQYRELNKCRLVNVQYRRPLIMSNDGRALQLNMLVGRVQHILGMYNIISGDGLPHDSHASTTKTKLDMKGVESLARALAVNRSLKMLNSIYSTARVTLTIIIFKNSKHDYYLSL